MTVTVLHIWVCDNCGKQFVQTIDEGVFSDPVITPPTGWDAFTPRPLARRQHPTCNVMDTCEKCTGVLIES